MQEVLDRRAIVIFAYDQDDLAMVQALKDYLAGTRVIIVLHQINAKTVKLGLSISPCFMTCVKSDFSDIIAVLEKIAIIEQ